jgi:hypothetical protein
MIQVYGLTRALYFGAVEAETAATELGALRAQAAALLPKAQGAAARALGAFNAKAAPLEGQRPAPGARGGVGGGERGGTGLPARPVDNLWAVGMLLGSQMNSMQAADVAPTAATLAAVSQAQGAAALVMARWTALKRVDLPVLNAALKQAGLTPIGLPARRP